MIFSNTFNEMKGEVNLIAFIFFTKAFKPKHGATLKADIVYKYFKNYFDSYILNNTKISSFLFILQYIDLNVLKFLVNFINREFLFLSLNKIKNLFSLKEKEIENSLKNIGTYSNPSVFYDHLAIMLKVHKKNKPELWGNVSIKPVSYGLFRKKIETNVLFIENVEFLPEYLSDIPDKIELILDGKMLNLFKIYQEWLDEMILQELEAGSNKD